MHPTPAPILQRLRAETHPYHEALEQNEFNQHLGRGEVTAALTQRFLVKLYGFLVPYEEALRRHPLPAAWEMASRYRAHLIRQDLPTAGLPLCPDMPPLHTWPQRLGALYVMEGSTLGGQVITRQLAKAGIGERAYFTGYGPQTGHKWKAFCHLLAEAAPAAGEDEIVASAIVTFQKLAQWIDQP